MIRRILVAVDASDLSVNAYQEAIALAKALGSELKLFHVLTDGEPGAPQRNLYFDEAYYPAIDQQLLSKYEKDWNAYVEDCLEWLKWQAAEARQAGIETQFDQVYGSPGRRICEAAKAWNADLIVMGNRGRSGLNELLLGSVSSYVMHHASCSVFIVHANPQKTDPLPEKSLSELMPA